ncbi:hypothetical protein Ahy_A04g021460 [Arachis hypogaea]|uniref:Protein FAR1-RELATED SEQUENCE n=1 Tax=Arachis hypogaea TaxID=3818 RepID=A0A445DKU8_ARAHY|nr:hypothetical protein Ahy_A04g021460 [Arachis hypogaea]
MPIAVFVGVNHHRNLVLLSDALLGNVETESFKWIMQIWVKCMKKISDGILTDQCETLFTTIQNVMPNTRPRLYFWHITKKILQKLERFSVLKKLILQWVGLFGSLVDKNYLRVYGITSLKSTTFIITNGSTSNCNLSPRVMKDNQYFYEVTEQKICPDKLNAFWRPPHLVLRERSSFKRLGADMNQKVAAVEGNKHSNKATKRHITANKHPNIYFSVLPFAWSPNARHIKRALIVLDYILDSGQN